MNESTQIIELLNNENPTFTNIFYKAVNRTNINNMNNNSFSNNKIRFNTKELANHLVSYQDAYILLEVDIKFAEEANALPANIRLKNGYEMVNSNKIELNRTIISNEDYIYYSNMIPHLLEKSKNGDLLYRGIDLHNNVTFTTNTNKNILITNANVVVTVKIPIYLKDISDYFRQLNFTLEFCEYNISIQIVDEIYHKNANMKIESQTIKSAYLFRTIPIFDNYVMINDDKIEGNNFTIHVNNVHNYKNMYLMFIKDNSIVKIPNKSCSNIQMKINSEKFQNVIENNIDAFLMFKNRSPYTNEFLLNYNHFLNNYLIYCFPLDRMIKYDSGSKSINIDGDPDDNSRASAIIYQQSAYMNLKIENKSLMVTKIY